MIRFNHLQRSFIKRTVNTVVLCQQHTTNKNQTIIKSFSSLLLNNQQEQNYQQQEQYRNHDHNNLSRCMNQQEQKSFSSSSYLPFLSSSSSLQQQQQHLSRGSDTLVLSKISSSSLSSLFTTMTIASSQLKKPFLLIGQKQQQRNYTSVVVAAPIITKTITNTNQIMNNNNINHKNRNIKKIIHRSFASKKHKRILRYAKGYRGRSKNCFTIAIRRVEKAWQYSYRDRKVKHRLYRTLWIQRIHAGLLQYNGSNQGTNVMNYSRFIPSLLNNNIHLNRKVLSELACHEPFSFKSIYDIIILMNGKNNQNDLHLIKKKYIDDDLDDHDNDEKHYAVI